MQICIYTNLWEKVVIGISGWRYPLWRGVFYPEGLRRVDELAFASRALPSIELNGSFYGLQRPESYAAWHAATPSGFIFSYKGDRYITHIQRLRDIEGALANTCNAEYVVCNDFAQQVIDAEQA